MSAFKEILIGGYVLRFWPSDNGWMCGITESMMDALAQQVVPPQRTWVGLMRGVRVEGNAVVITVKGGNDEARALCGELINQMEKNGS